MNTRAVLRPVPALVLLLGLLAPQFSMAGALDQLQTIGGSTGNVPDPGTPVCVANCGGASGGSSRQSDDGYQRAPAQRQSAPRKVDPVKAGVYQGLKQGLDNAFKIDPQAIQRAHQKQMQGAQMLQDAQTAEQQTEDARRTKAARDAASERAQRVRAITGDLQAMPATGNDLSGLVPGLPAGQQPLDTDLETLRARAGSGFDTPGRLMGDTPRQPPPPAAPRPDPAAQSLDQRLARMAAQGKLTPEMQKKIKERDALREQKRDLEQQLARMESKGQLSPAETVELSKLKQEISTAQNKENYSGFTINQELESVSDNAP
ncbi:MAG: hypothetical protein P4L39_01075 [Humidesulfovibrio sp.]|nr:hypothetical protein [Humidesulfovibrio sp.]